MRKIAVLMALVLGMFLIITRGPTYSGGGSGSYDIFGAYPNGGFDGGGSDGRLANAEESNSKIKIVFASKDHPEGGIRGSTLSFAMRVGGYRGGGIGDENVGL
ncbi:MAG: hypothetical protein AABX01_03580 [Candidatus Micrarchaeota archaeon]